MACCPSPTVPALATPYQGGMIPCLLARRLASLLLRLPLGHHLGIAGARDGRSWLCHPSGRCRLACSLERFPSQVCGATVRRSHCHCNQPGRNSTGAIASLQEEGYVRQFFSRCCDWLLGQWRGPSGEQGGQRMLDGDSVSMREVVRCPHTADIA